MATVLKTRSMQFPEDLNDALTAAAAERGVSVNWLVGQLCREGLERLEPVIRVTA